MGREIKFRGWCERDIEWRHGFYITDGKVHEINTLLDCGTFYASQINHESLGQYTGLKDKSGAEIYEGDIVEQEVGFDDAPLNKEIDNVIFDGCKFKTNSFELNLVSFGSFLIHYKVIGNIYENPELLEGGE